MSDLFTPRLKVMAILSVLAVLAMLVYDILKPEPVELQSQANIEHDRFISYYEHAMNDGYVDTDIHVQEDEAYRLDVNAQLMCNLIEQTNNLVEPFEIGTKLGMSSDQTRYVIEGAVLVYCPMYTTLLDTGAM